MNATSSNKSRSDETFITRHKRVFNEKQAKRYTRFVTLMKMLLPGAALALIAAIVVYSALYEQASEKMSIKFQQMEYADEELRMLNPRFTGTDEDGQPYVVTADSALQDKTDQDVLKLENIEGDITLNESMWISLQSPSGTLNSRTSELELDDRIDFYTDSGYEFHAQNAKADLRAGHFETSLPVHGQGPSGRLEAENMLLNTKEGRIYFAGGVRVILYPEQIKKDSLVHSAPEAQP